MNLNDLKSETIKFVRNYYSENVIYPTYPSYKQTNYGPGVYNDPVAKQTMVDFINGKRADEHGIESDINALIASDMWDNFVSGTDSEIAAYIYTYLTNLDTTEKKMAAATSVRRVKSLFKV
jgi:hypothetical protein